MTVDRQAFREALAHWGSGVAIVACRHEGRVVATTVSALMSLSTDPPLLLLAIGPNATIRPFLIAGTPLGVSILAADQRRIAMVFADPFPVGPDPFADTGVPLIPDALVGLTCHVDEAHTAADHLLVTAAVDDARVRHGSDPLIRFNRRYHALGA